MININDPKYDQFRRSKIPGVPSLMRKDGVQNYKFQNNKTTKQHITTYQHAHIQTFQTPMDMALKFLALKG